MNISVYGAGYVGLVSSACLAKIGHRVICADINPQKIAMLSEAKCPIYEAELPELLAEQVATKQLSFTTDLVAAIEAAELHIIATGTPSLDDGSADLTQVFSIAKWIASSALNDAVIVTKSTVPVGTGDALQEFVNENLVLAGKDIQLTLTSNPEFLREGTAINDFLNADRIVIGGEKNALEIVEEMYQPLIQKGIPLLKLSRRSAELSKYAANAMLATKISFINQISQLAEKSGADIEEISQVIGLDHRIGPHFLQAGIGYGGSCFPKDLRALCYSGSKLKVAVPLLAAIEEVNARQKNWIIEQLNHHFANQLQGLTIAIWGLAFKPGTDDLREASSLVAIQSLLAAGVRLRLYDPVAMKAAKKELSDDAAISWCDAADAVFNAQLDALIIVTEWAEFKHYNLRLLKQQLNGAVLIDGRNCFDLASIKALQLGPYYSVGRPLIASECMIGRETCK